MSESGIYKISFVGSDKFYIGSTNDFKRRRKEHKWTLKNNKHCNPMLQNFYNKYNKENFVFEVVEECGVELLLQREQFYLDTLKPYLNVHKLAIGGCTWHLGPKREVIIEKIRKAQKGKIVSEETKQLLREIRTGEFMGQANPFYNRHHTEETKQKLREKGVLRPKNIGFSGRTHSEESKLKTSNALLGKARVTYTISSNDTQIEIHGKKELHEYCSINHISYQTMTKTGSYKQYMLTKKGR